MFSADLVPWVGSAPGWTGAGGAGDAVALCGRETRTLQDCWSRLACAIQGPWLELKWTQTCTFSDYGLVDKRQIAQSPLFNFQEGQEVFGR